MTAAPKPDQLLPCPHCGQSDTVVLAWDSEIAGDDWTGENTDTRVVVCDASHPNGRGGCGASGGFSEDESVAISKWNRRAPPHDGGCISAAQGMDAIRKAMQEDYGYAWSWHCNVAMAAHDAGAPIEKANERAAQFMRNAFDIDTSSGHPTTPPRRPGSGEEGR